MEKESALLIVFAGLPGSGKTTIAEIVARDAGATYLRIDVIEAAVRSSLGLGEDVGAAGYTVAYGVAESNLKLGRIVLADSVNPIRLTRGGWRQVAVRGRAPLLEVEIVCSDAAEHRRRVESRSTDLAGLTLPSWEAVTAREYEPWPDGSFVIDTASVSAAEAASLVAARIQADYSQPH